MFNSTDIKNYIMELVSENRNIPYIIGKGIVTKETIGFDKAKIALHKQEFAKLLLSLGMGDCSIVNLTYMTTLKNGEVWNKVRTFEDFQALELLLACADACGFICNDDETLDRNIREIGDEYSLLIFGCGRALINDKDKWVGLVRDHVIDKMYYIVNCQEIKDWANGLGQEETIEHGRK